MPVQIPSLHISTTAYASETTTAPAAIVTVSGQTNLAANPPLHGFLKIAIPTSIQFGAPTTVQPPPPPAPYPVGHFTIDFELAESGVGTVNSTSIDQINSYGTLTPTIVLTGRCTYTRYNRDKVAINASFWLLIASNSAGASAVLVGPSSPAIAAQAVAPSGQGGVQPPAVPATVSTPEIVSLLVFDGAGNRLVYGTGIVTTGHIFVAQESN